MEIVLELVMTLYLECSILIIPEDKLNQKFKTLLKLLCLIVSTTIFILLFVGVSFIIEKDTDFQAGIIMTSVGSAALLIHGLMYLIVLYSNYKSK